ncbi:hypothetical protein [Bradyrhizobium sp. ERR14]|uniref:hypothetical protein n=1 Tax=Bradyrhizobium sp. ERR14 TaxID=2663837 RepID=UPI001618A939|nr:hypothetical protein [Bradyrhizobium sp. ERR14]
MPTVCGSRPQQSPGAIVDVATWRKDEENPIFPVDSKPKRLLSSPSEVAHPFLIAGHRYLYKIAQGWREQQTWSEVIAYEIAKSLSLQVPGAFAAIDSSDGTMGVLVEFFYGYPQRIRRGQSFDPGTDRPHSVQMNVRVCSTVGAKEPLQWWAKTLTFDALIGNTDRHSQNWGFLVSRIRPEQVDLDLAPIFDNGTSLGYEFGEARLQKKWTADQIAGYIGKGRHHLSWAPEATSGSQHIDLCVDLAKSSAEASAAAKDVIRLSRRHRTSFAPETTQPKHNERDQIQTKGQQNQRSQSLSRRS